MSTEFDDPAVPIIFIFNYSRLGKKGSSEGDCMSLDFGSLKIDAGMSSLSDVSVDEKPYKPLGE